VRRPRLERLLAEGERRQVTLVSAMAGAGKTTLLTSCLADAPPGRVAWLTLDHRDDEPGRLAQLVVTALARTGVTDGFDPPPVLGEDLYDALFEHLEGRGRPSLLVLDDVHEVSSRAALAGLEHLIRRAPPELHLVLATRADPPLRWGSLDVEGRLRQVRNAELRFNTEEGAQLLRRHGVRLGHDDVEALCERTEGWAAGLRLAACALQGDAEPRKFVLSAAATQVAVSDYLLTEVLDREDDTARQFLLRTSVADRLTPDLARALSADQRAGERLRRLERRGIFLVELDDDGSYRYHALFAALLRARLRLRDPALFAALHRRAATWHLARGLASEAEHHAREAEDWGLVGRLALERWLDAALLGGVPEPPVASPVPPRAVVEVPELAVVAAAEACRQGDRHEADAYRTIVDAAVDRHATPVVAMARLVLDLDHGRAFGVSERSERALDDLFVGAGTGPWTAGAHRLAAVRAAEMALERPGAPARAALAAVVSDPGAGPLASEAVALGGLLDALAGRIAVAEATASRLLATHGSHTATSADAARLTLAFCHAQRGDARAMADALASVGPSIVASRALRAVGDVARSAGRHRPGRAPTVDAATLGHPLAAEALVALGAPEVVDADGRCHTIERPGMRLVRAYRRRLAGEAPEPDAESIDSWLDGQAPQDGPGGGPGPHPRTLVEANLLAALVAGGAGDDDLADRRVNDALALLHAFGIQAPFGHHAGRLAPRLRRSAAQPGPYAGLAIDLVDRAGDTGEALVVDALTDRELEVLRRLPTLMSNVEIADDMNVSINTVKSHLKAVYRKLAVDGRRHAVLRGRELDLV
jgi:LuxR family maltose regulon positive regulatory protein